MRQTLFLIPHEIFGLPVFGVGWALLALSVLLMARLLWARQHRQPLGDVISSEAVMWVIVAAAIVFLLPAVELKNLAGQPVGMAIRGYGAMMLAGVVAAVGLAAVRAKNRGLEPEVIFSLAPWVFIGGIVGARLFYVIQYRDKFIADTIGATIRNIVAFTEGGLVVYGSIVGGLIAALFYISRHRLPVWKLGDAIIPCIFLGIFLGRIGCLLNGCCYGGRCEEGWASVQFPPGSPVYQEQLYNGELLGIQVDPITLRIDEVTPGGLADRVGIAVGDRLEKIEATVPPATTAPLDIPGDQVPRGARAVIDGKIYTWAADQLPGRALPVQAVQVFSSVSALVLCCLLCGLSYIVRREGAVMMYGFAGYAVLRFVLEIIRVDEGGQFGTELSISQWVSICVLVGSVVGLIWLHQKRPPAVASASSS